MDARPQDHAEPRHGWELDDSLRRAVKKVRVPAAPAGSLARALERARRPGVPAWRFWLLQGAAGRN
jgi:hypothetical protein